MTLRTPTRPIMTPAKPTQPPPRSSTGVSYAPTGRISDGDVVAITSSFGGLGVWCSRGPPRIEQAERLRAADGLRSGRHVELAIDRVCLGLDRVLRHAHGLRDLTEGEMDG